MGVIYSGPALHPEEDIVSKPFIAQEQRLTLVDKLLELYKKFTYLFYGNFSSVCVNHENLGFKNLFVYYSWMAVMIINVFH